MRTFCEKHNLEKTFNKYYECKICTKEYKDAYYKKHREKYMKKMKEYYEKNKEVLHEKMREYHEKNKEKIQKYWIEYSKTYIKTEKARIIRK